MRVQSIGEVIAWGLVVVFSGLLILMAPVWAPIGIGLSLIGAIPTWLRGWNEAEGTTLRGALVWAALAIGLGILAQAMAAFEPCDLGRPGTGRVTYLMVLAMLAALVSVLGARTPGGAAWAILMVLLVLVFLIPWLEISGRVHRGPAAGQVRLDSPWTLFYALLSIAGVMNYLPTRYGPSAISIGAGLVCEYLGLTRPGWSHQWRATAWALVSWSLAVGLWLAAWQGRRTVTASSATDRLWFWFRDHFGVVWGIRTSERFNHMAELAKWPLRLSWFGLVPNASAEGEPSGSQLEQAEATLRNLIRRFVTPQRIDRLLGTSETGSCHSVPSPE